MATETVTVGVVIERRVPTSHWIDALFLPVAVLPGAPGLAAWTRLGTTDTGERFYAGAFEMGLHRTDTPTYRDNLASGNPRIWVAARLTGAEPPLAIVGVTADPAEGESYTEAGDDIVEHVPMAPELQALLAGFVAEHHVERAFIKRKRKRWASSEDEESA